MSDLTDRIEWLRQRAEFPNRKAAAQAYGINYDLFKAIARGDRNLTLENATAIARHHRISAGWLLFGEGTPEGEFSVPLRGTIGGGQEMILFEDMGEQEKPVNGLLGGPGVSAFEVSGESMFPLAARGDIVFFGPPKQDMRTLVGRECAVVLQDGRRFFKIIERGSKAGVYDLRSYNWPPIRDVEIHEAGEFLGMRRVQSGGRR